MNATLAAAYAAYNLTKEPGEPSLVGSIVKGWSYNLALAATAAGAVVFVTSLVVADVALGILGGVLFVIFGLLSYSLDGLATNASLNEVADKLTQIANRKHRIESNLKKDLISLESEVKKNRETIKKFEAMPARLAALDKKLANSALKNEQLLKDYNEVTQENKEIAEDMKKIFSSFTIEVDKIPEETEAIEALLITVTEQVKQMGDGMISLTKNNQTFKKHMESYSKENQEFAASLENVGSLLADVSTHSREQADQIEELKSLNQKLDENQDQLEETTDGLHDTVNRLDKVTTKVDEKVEEGNKTADEVLKLLVKENS